MGSSPIVVKLFMIQERCLVIGNNGDASPIAEMFFIIHYIYNNRRSCAHSTAANSCSQLEQLSPYSIQSSYLMAPICNCSSVRNLKDDKISK